MGHNGRQIARILRNDAFGQHALPIGVEIYFPARQLPIIEVEDIAVDQVLPEHQVVTAVARGHPVVTVARHHGNHQNPGTELQNYTAHPDKQTDRKDNK